MHELPRMASSVYGSSTSSLAFADDLYDPIKQLLQRENIMAAVITQPRRLVKVVIMDPNPNIPLVDCVLHSGDEFMTDANDQELFFDIDIKSMLTKHNEKRVEVVDKTIKDRTEYLEAAKVRDLKMVVVSIAVF